MTEGPSAARSVAWLVWLAVPFGLWAWHQGPGQEGLALDRVHALLRSAEDHTRRGEHALAYEALDEALRGLPPGHAPEARRIRLERAKAGLESAKLPESRAELEALVDELQKDPAADPQVATEARRALASSQFYMTWLMRLEGLPKEVWEPEVDAARQQYRLLAEEAGDPATKAARQEDLAAAVKLARMDPAELVGLPIPST
jgi:hypothetical protein